MTFDRRQYYFQILVLSLVIFPTICTTAIFGILSDILYDVAESIEEFTCSHISCCQSHLEPTKWSWMWYRDNLLHGMLHSKLFGQHLVEDAVLRGISLHMTKPKNRVLLHLTIKKLQDHLQVDIPFRPWGMWDDPHKNWEDPRGTWNDPNAKYDKLIHEEYERIKKLFGGALVIFLYGATGTGKSYTTEIIAESLYKKGLNSPLVHHFGGKAFISLEKDEHEYGLKLLDWIDGNITQCPNSMFIFDEFNELPMDLIRLVMKSAISTHNRDAIFIFIMNTDDSGTMEKMLALYEKGKIREDIKLEDVQKPGFRELFLYLEKKYGLDKCIDEEKFMNGRPKNPIIASFLPMEKQHVRKCIIDNYITKGEFPSDDIIRSIQNYVKYGPVGKEKFSLSGCKHIHALVTSALSRKYKSEKEEL